MSLSENDGDNAFVRHFQHQQTKSNNRPQQQQQQQQQSQPQTPQPQQKRSTKAANTDEFSPAVSWPILLAVIPTLGAFFAGSAEIWSDFIMLLLILYYVYKWMTGK
jgi:Flp pilus assembly protein TadB